MFDAVQNLCAPKLLRMIRALILLFGLIYTQTIYCQEWKWAQSWGPKARLVDFAIDGSDNVIGCFSGIEVDFGDTVFNTGSNYLAKLDNNGNLIWVRHFGEASPSDITTDQSGNILITGTYHDTLKVDTVRIPAVGQSDCFTAKLDPSGNLIWVKVGVASHVIFPRMIKADNNGNVIIYGDYRGQATFGSSMLVAPTLGFDMFIVKYDGFGNPSWLKSLGSPSSNQAGLLEVTDANDVIVTGRFYDSLTVGSQTVYLAKGSTGLFIAAFTPLGASKWVQSFSGESFLIIRWCHEDPNGEVHLAGYFGNMAYFGNDTLGSGNPTARYFFLTKLDQTHNPIWAQTTEGQVSYCMGGDLLSNGDYVFGIAFRDTLIFGNDTVASNTIYDNLAILKLNALGDLRWHVRMEPTSPAIGNFVTNSKGEAYLGTTFSDSVIVGNNVFTTGSLIVQNALIAKAGDKSVGFSKLSTSEGDLTIFPNPSTGHFRLDLGKLYGSAKIWIYDVMGRIVYHGISDGDAQININLKDQSPGMYVIGVMEGQKYRTGRIIISR